MAAAVKNLRERSARDGLHMTIEEFLAWQPPDDGRWVYELDEGQVVISPSAYRWHNRVILYVAAALDRFVSRHELGEVGVEVDAVIDRRRKTVRRPDIYFISEARLNKYRDKGHLVDAADLVVEVTSEATRYVDLGRKRQQYEKNAAIREYWVLDILADPMAAYLYYRRGKKLVGGKVDGDRLVSRLLDGFELRLRPAWARARESRGW